MSSSTTLCNFDTRHVIRSLCRICNFVSEIVPVLSRYKQGLTSIFRRVHELKSDPYEHRLLALEIQEELLGRVSRAERAIRKLRAANKAIKVQLAQRGNPRELARQLQNDHKGNEAKIDLYKELLGIYGDIGDSIAFIYGDRWDLKQVAWKEKAGFITGKRGARLERAILRHTFEVGAVGVLNDLTNSLRHGDITVFREDGVFGLVEVKSGRGGKRSRAERQVAAAERVLAFLRDDRDETESGEIRIRHAWATEPVYHLEAINGLIAEVPANGWVHREVEKGLHYLVIADEVADEAMSNVLGHIGNRKAVVFLANNYKRLGVAYYPFILSMSDADKLYSFYNGEFVIVVLADIDTLSEAHIPSGYVLRITDDEGAPWALEDTGSSQGNGEPVLRMGRHIIGRIASEFLSAGSLLGHMIEGPLARVKSASPERSPEL